MRKNNYLRGLLVFSLLAVLSITKSFAQPASNYYLKSGGGVMTLIGENGTILGPGCSPSAGVTQYGFNSTFNTPTGTSCGGSNCVPYTGKTSTTVSPGSVGTNQVVQYSKRTVNYSTGPGCVATPQSATLNYNITVYTVADMTATGTFPTSICSTAGNIDVSGYINIAAAIKTGVSYTLDGVAMGSSTLSPGSISAGSHTLKASYTFSNDVSPTTTVTVGTFTLYTALNSLVSPTDQSICSSGTANFTASASGSGISYQWQESSNGGSSWSSLTNTGIYSGTTTATLTLTNPGLGHDGYLYRCYITDGGGCNNSYTANAKLNVYGQVSITSSPSAVSVCQGSSSSFTGAATAHSGSLSWQWQSSADGVTGWANVSDGTSNGTTFSGSTTATLSFSSTTTFYNGYYFRANVQDACGAVNANTTSSAKLTVYGNVSISGNPSNTTVCAGTNPTFSATGNAQNGSLQYQWQYWTGSAWQNLGNGDDGTGTVFSGVTGSTMTITNIRVGYSGYQFRCYLTDNCGSATANATSSATLTVNTPVAVSTNPSSPSGVCPGPASNVTISGLSVTGTSPTYQWQVSTDGGSTWASTADGSVYSGSTTSSLTVLKASISVSMNNYQYRCVVSSGVSCGSAVTSGSATLTVYTPVSISTQPTASSNLCPGATYSLSVVAVGSGTATYQWKKNGTAIGGATSSSYSIAGVAASDAATYTVTVSSQYGCNTVTSNNAVLAVYTPVSISTQPTGSSNLCPGATYSLSVVAAGSGTATYQWKKNGTTIGGATSSSYSIASVAASDAATYTVDVVSQYGCNTVTSSNAVLTVYTPVSISTQPTASTNLCPGATFNLSVTAAGSGTATYQWKKNGTAIGGATTSTFSIANVSASDAATYTVTVTSQYGCNNVTSSNAVLSVYGPPVFTTNLSSQSYCTGSTVTLTVAGTTSPGTLNYTWKLSTDGGTTYNTITNIAPYSGATTASLSIASVPGSYAGYKYQVFITDATCSTNTTASAVATITPYAAVTTTNPVNAGVCPGGNTSFVSNGTPKNGSATYQWQVNPGSGFVNLTNGGIYSGVTTSTLALTGVTAAYNNYKYQAIVQDGCGGVTQMISTPATLTVYTGATINTQPTASTICSGGNTSFTVAATASNGPLSYQWYVNPNTGTFVPVGTTAVYSGATTATLSLTAPPNTYNSYQYYVNVKDACSGITVTSQTVSLFFYTAIPVTTPPSAQTVCPNAAASFKVVATANSGSLSPQWQVNTGSGWSNVTNTAPYSGATTTTLSISSAPVTMNGYLYRVILLDGCGAATQYTSSGVGLTVNNSVGISTNLPATTSPCVNGAMVLTVNASGTGLTYQWQENASGTWNNITNVGIYSGATTNILTISSVPLSYNGFQYRLNITGTCSSATSNISAVSVVQPPTITTDPAASTFCEATTGTLSVTASGSSPTYQWQYSSTGGSGTFTTIIGATSSTLSIASLAITDAGYYNVVVSNSCGSTTSNKAQMTVNPVTAITTAPALNVATCPGGTATLGTGLVANGTAPFSYQWYYGDLSTAGDGPWTSLAGKTSSTHSVTNASAGNTGYYYVAVSSQCGGTKTSGAILLTVNPTPTAPTIADVSRCGDGALSATATSLAPSPSFNWYKNASDVVPVYTGNTYNILNLKANDTYYVTTVSQGCESAQSTVNYNHITPASVTLGADLNLCAAQGTYNLANDISSTNASGGTFTWSDGKGTNYSGNNFDPSVGAGTYVVTYTPTAAEQLPSTCYIPTTRNVKVTTSSGTAGIVFSGTGISGGNTLNTCVGDAPVDLSTFVNISGGTWSTVSGSGISSSGKSTLFTPDNNSYTSTSPNVFRYTVSSNGCTGSSDLSIYVKDNKYSPTVSGLPSVICPGTTLTLAANVSQPGTYSYNWFTPGATTPFSSNVSSIKYVVTKDTTLYVSSQNSPFGCNSIQTAINIVTPFKAGVISVDKSSIQIGGFVKFTFTGGATGNSFSWTFNDGFTSVEQNPVHYYYDSGNYVANLHIVSSLGCTEDLSYSQIAVKGTPYSVILGDIDRLPVNTDVHVSVFPNPADNTVNVTSDLKLYNYTLSNLSGVKIQGNAFSAEGQQAIPLHDVTPGVYILIVESEKGRHYLKLIKR